MKKDNRSKTTHGRLAIDYLLAYLDNPDLNHAALDAAISHMKECPACASRVGHLVQALTSDEEDQLTCQECQDLLPGYVRAEANGQARQSQWHLVMLHLQTCPHCAEAHGSLADLIALADGERGLEPPEYPVPELSFLRDNKDEPPYPLEIPWHINRLGTMVVEFSAELIHMLQTPPYKPAYAPGLKTAGEQRVLCQLSLKEAKDLEVTVTVEEQQDDPVHCTIIIEVNIPSKEGWPNLAGSKVVLKRGQELLETQWTDAFGKAIFERVRTKDLPHLVFEITPTANTPQQE